LGEEERQPGADRAAQGPFVTSLKETPNLEGVTALGRSGRGVKGKRERRGIRNYMEIPGSVPSGGTNPK